MTLMLAAIFLLGSDGAALTAPVTAVAAIDPKKMSQSEIRAHNAKLARTDPNFIRCVRSAEVGSLVARNYSCRTVEQWHKSDLAGNDEARRVRDEMSSKAMNTN